MCVIAACKPGYRPTKGTLKMMFDANPDGAGIAWTEDGEVIIAKGFMTFGELYDYMENYTPTNAPMMIHCRIGTSGGYGPYTTHPYPITDNLEYLHAIDLSCKIAIAHNGVISGMPTDSKKKISDTISYIKKVVYPLSMKKRALYGTSIAENKKACHILARRALGNRFCVLDSAGNIRTVGAGWTNLNAGIKVSNRAFLDYVPYHYSSKKEDYTSAFDVAYYDHKSERFILPSSCGRCDNKKDCSSYYPICVDVFESGIYD